LVISAQAAQSAKLLVGIQEACCVWEVVHHPPTEDTDKDCHQTLDDDCPMLAGFG
jgi:hypothetical protein